MGTQVRKFDNLDIKKNADTGKLLDALKVRKFNFFDIKKNVDNGKLLDALKDVKITCISAGCGLILIGDANGWAHLVSRQFDVASFEAHSSEIILVDIHSSSNLAVTVSNPCKNEPSHIKIWMPDMQSTQELPVCARELALDPRSFYENKNIQVTSCPLVTAVELHPNNSLMAVGFDDGSIMLYRGDVRRQHGTKYKLIVTLSGGSITNLQIRMWENHTHLFVTTTSRVYCIDCSTKDKETTIQLDDKIGCKPQCSTLTDSKHEYAFLVAKNDAIYSYTTDSRASCYGFTGNKIYLSAYKGYLIVVSNEKDYHGNFPIKLSIFDPMNKLISLSTEFIDIAGVVCEWGSLFIITREPSIVQLCEKDLQTKFDILFKKNQFDIAVNMAKMQCCGAEDISEILKQYGDWLHSKGNFSDAVDQYIKTIPHLEPSYIIRKYIEPQHISHLTTYLQSLHIKGFSNSNHKTLLLNCYTRLRDTRQLNEFIMNKDGQLDCDVELGIKVCRSAAYYDHALALASQNMLHNTYISILINDKKEFESAIRYIKELEFEEARESILQYGSVLLSHHPVEMTELLVNICTNYVPSNQEKSNDVSAKKADPEDFEYLLVGHSVGVNFLERLSEISGLSSHLNTTLLAELLHQYSDSSSDHHQILGEKIIRILNNSEKSIDRDHALLLCNKHRFYAGRMILWEQAGMFEEIISFYADHHDFDSVLDTCTKHGEKNQHLWCLSLRKITAEKITKEPNFKYLNIILQKIEENKLLPLMEVVDILSCSSFVTLGQVRDYLLRVVASHTASLTLEASNINKYRHETSKMKKEITNLTTEAREFTATKCCVCNNNLDLPSIHFLCKHSFHMHCFESYTGSDSECPLCLPEYKKLSESIDIQAKNLSKQDYLHEQVESSSDCFSVIADFISKGALSANQNLSFLHPQPYCKVPEKEKNYGALEKTYVGSAKGVSEGRLRLAEAAPKVFEIQSEARIRGDSKSINTGSQSEGRIRASQTSTVLYPETRVHRSDWKPLTLHEHISHADSIPEKEKSLPSDISSAISNKRSYCKSNNQNPFESVAENPFQHDNQNQFGEYETEESSNNPFEDEYDNSKNPFAEDDDNKLEKEKLNNPLQEYDETLNPFGE